MKASGDGPVIIARELALLLGDAAFRPHVATHVPGVIETLMPTQLGAFAIDLLWFAGGSVLWWPLVVPALLSLWLLLLLLLLLPLQSLPLLLRCCSCCSPCFVVLLLFQRTWSDHGVGVRVPRRWVPGATAGGARS